MKSSSVSKEDYDRLVDEIWKHNRLYYIDHSPIISDQEFDKLLKELEEIELLHPEWVTPSSPTQRVNETPSGAFVQVPHKVPMLSLANSYSKEEVKAFLTRVAKLTNDPDMTFCLELKMDGIAISATFKDGLFVRGATRGDGKVGDDITNNMRTILTLPLKLKKPWPKEVEVRGEVFMPHTVFAKLNQECEEKGIPLFANPRNAASGSLKLLDAKEVAKRSLQTVFYAVAPDNSLPPKTQFEVHAYLEQLGLPILHQLKEARGIDEILDFIQHIEKIRPTLPFDIDGVVIKVNSLKEQGELGSASKSPRWAIAYKFAAEQATTTIKEITIQVGRTGVLTPVAELVPTLLAGSTISRATLHNREEIERLDIRVGDQVIIEKGGDVIPKVVGVVNPEREGRGPPFTMPNRCPCCDTPVVEVADEVAIRCPNHNCPGQLFKKLTFFVCRDAMDISGLGEKVIHKLIELGLVKHPSDLFLLDAEKLSLVEGFKERSIQNLLSALEKAKEPTLARFILALGIRHVGQGTAEEIASHVDDIGAVMSLKLEDLLEMEGIGEKVAQSVVDFFQDLDNVEEVRRLLKYGVKPKKGARVATDSPFSGKTCVITGTLSDMSRQEAADKIVERGGKVSDTVSKKTDYLIVGENPGSKLKKAESLGVTILNESEFKKLLL